MLRGTRSLLAVPFVLCAPCSVLASQALLDTRRATLLHEALSGELAKEHGEAWVESFPSDGRTAYQTWPSPSGWHITGAELRMLEPYEGRIVGYPEIAMSVITYSNAGDVTAELVWVWPGTRDAVVCFLDDERAQEYPDMLQYTGMWPRTDELERVTFGRSCAI